MTFASAVTAFEAAFQKDETWVVSEIAKGWQLVKTAEQTAAVDVENVFAWVKAHQTDILSLFQKALTGLEAIGSVIPSIAPEVASATAAIDAATAAVDVLSKGLTVGTTPMSTLTNAYQSVKTAQTAVTTVFKAATSQTAAKAS